MNKQLIQKYWMGILTLSVIALSTWIASADEGKMQTMQSPANWQSQMRQEISVTSFFRTDLTETEKWEIKTIMDSMGSSLKVILSDSTTTVDAKLASVKDLNEKQKQSLLQYVDTAKLDSFKIFMDSRIDNLAKALQNQNMKWQMWVNPSDKYTNQNGMKMGEMKDMKWMNKWNWEMDMFKFFRTDLTSDEKASLAQTLDAMKTDMKTIMDNTSLTDSQKQDACKTLSIKYTEALLAYVDSTKVEEFKKFFETMHSNMHMQWKGNMMDMTGSWKSTDNGMKMWEMKREMAMPMVNKPKFTLLTAGTVKSLDKKIDAIDDSKKETFLKAVISKVDALLTSSTGKRKMLLEELNVYLKGKLSDITPTEDTNLINDIVQ